MGRAVVLAALLAVASACGGEAAAPPRPTPEPTSDGTMAAGPAADCVETAEVVAVDNDYDPLCLIASPGAELTLTNEGGLPHTFTIRDTEVDEVLQPGGSATIAVPDTLEPNAETEFTCRFHPGMVGYLYVQA